MDRPWIRDPVRTMLTVAVPLEEPAQLPREPEAVKTGVLREAAGVASSVASPPSTSFTSNKFPPNSPAATHPPKPPTQYVPDDDVADPAYGQGRYEMDVPANSAKTTIHWSKGSEHFTLSSTIPLPSGTSKPMPRLQNVDKNDGADKERLAIIKATAEHAWSGYKAVAWKADEIKPISGGKSNPFNGWGATLVDALDTLWIMGMKEEFEEAVEAVAGIDFTTSQRGDIPLFETTIRYLGGMIAAYDLSGTQYTVLLDKAVELAEILYGAFDTPNRMPVMYPRWAPSYTSQPRRAGARVVLAEIGSLSVEFTRLAQLTGEPKYYDAIARITDEFEAWQNDTRLPGMWPTYVDASGCAKPAGGATYTTGVQHEADDGSGKVEVAGPPVKGGGSSLTAQQAAVEQQRQQQQNLDRTRFQSSKVADHGSSKVKRQLENSDAVRAADEQSNIVKTQHHGDIRSPPNSLEPCTPQGLSSTTKTGLEIFTLGGMSDSMYEYLPKEHMLLGGSTRQYEKMYVASADAVIDKLLYRPLTPENLDILFSGELRVRRNLTTMEFVEDHVANGAHLTCFAGGMFALGGVLFDRPGDVQIGAKLTDGCVWAYNSTTTGIMPEDFTTLACDDEEDCTWNEERYWHALDPYEETRTAVRNNYLDPAQVIPKATAPPRKDALRPEKRQLGETGIDEPQPPQPDNVPAAIPAPPNAPQPRRAPHLAGPKLQIPAPVYTPKPPLSHKDYVKEKIRDERLPPGMISINSRGYILRPEAIESVFYMYRITGDQHWRDAGWEMFTAIHDHTQAVYGNSAIDDVTKEAPEGRDSEESFWLAETLKYFYLLFDEPSTWSLDEWVLNTEAHFFKRPKYEFRE